jgi:hypothetical protein
MTFQRITHRDQLIGILAGIHPHGTPGIDDAVVVEFLKELRWAEAWDVAHGGMEIANWLLTELLLYYRRVPRRHHPADGN